MVILLTPKRTNEGLANRAAEDSLLPARYDRRLLVAVQPLACREAPEADRADALARGLAGDLLARLPGDGLAHPVAGPDPDAG